ncbi:hypothetical protein TSUD_316160 [Trifolium subterraneum]|uniref:RNase H type-1 domain-containing protein n=1 Tax=Trifolium subterraneum TaxID=3900 RepID=A0A2Z6NJ76_TRISU|nr:hypothetical protein TSUD_316160 [Trifolium subterraneum]
MDCVTVKARDIEVCFSQDVRVQILSVPILVLNTANKAHITWQVAWIPPTATCLKLNNDGFSFENPGCAGFGGLIRNDIGEWMHGFSGSCCHASNILAELYAILEGLQLAWNLGYRTITLECDSK